VVALRSTARLEERYPAWPDLAGIAVRESRRDDGRKPATTVEAHPCIASLPADAARFAAAARSPRSIDDAGRTGSWPWPSPRERRRIRRGNGAATFATLGRSAHDLPPKTPAGASPRVKRGRVGWDHAFLHRVLTPA
jgi:hypothetical protein